LSGRQRWLQSQSAGYDEKMVWGERRRSPGAPAVLRWIAADARDVARIDRTHVRPAVAVETIAGGVRRWQHRVERRRRLALMRRAALVGLGAACVMQIGALATGSSGTGAWLIPGALLAAVALAIGIAHPTRASSAARLLDRDLGLGAKVATALELENSQGLAAPRGLAALALADGRAALVASLALARARVQPRRGELALLAALVAGFVVLLLVPSPRSGVSATAATAKARTAPPSSRALRAENGLLASADPGPSLQGFKQTPLEAPPLAAVQAGGTTRSGGASSGHSPYGGGLANNAAAGSNQPASRTAGQSGSVQGSQDIGRGPSPAGQGKGSLPNSQSGGNGESIPGGNSASKGGPGSTSVAPVGSGRPSGSAPSGTSAGAAGKGGGQSRGGVGSSAPGNAPGRQSTRSAPGGATAGSTGGTKNRGKGVVPELGGRSALPIAPGYESIPGAEGATNESASSAEGQSGGAGHSGQAIGGVAGSGGGAGVPYVPPGGASVAAIDRGVVLGYFASFARVNASGW
jgi:hypothetical protein